MKTALVVFVFALSLLDARASETRSLRYYDVQDQSNSIQDLVPKTAAALCPMTGVGKYRISYKASCRTDNKNCNAIVNLEHPIPRASVYVTPDLQILFSKAEFPAQPASPKTTTQTKRLPSGTVMFLTLNTTSHSSDLQELASFTECFETVAQALRAKFPPSETQMEVSGLKPNTAETDSFTRTLSALDYANLKVSYQPSLDVREDGLVTIEVTPSQKFVYEISQDEMSYALGQIANRLLKAKMDLPTSPPPTGISGSFEYEAVESHYSPPTLSPVPLDHRQLEAVLESTEVSPISLTPTHQPIAPLHTTRWLWRVAPKDKLSTVTLHIKITDATTEAPTSPLFYHALQIKFSEPWDYRIQLFISKHWEWLAATVVSPFIMFLWKRLRPTRPGKAHESLRQKLTRKNNAGRR